MFENIRRDSSRYDDQGGWFSSAGFWITAVYRFGMWGHTLPSRPLRIAVRVLYRLFRLPFSRFNVFLWAGKDGARIGPGLCLIHPHSIMIGRRVEIGEDCLIFHEVTIGTGHVPGTPKIGDRVDVYPGARVLGGIHIGDRSMIGANCVVTRDVPAESVTVSPVSRIIPRSMSPVGRTVPPPESSSVETPTPLP